MRIGIVASEAFQGLRRNVSMVVSVILVTFVSLTFVGVAILMQMQIGQMKTFWYDKAQVSIEFCTQTSVSKGCSGQEATQDQINAVKSQLDSDALKPYIKKYYFENRDQAYQEFKKQFANDPVSSIVEPSYFSQTYWVSLKDPSKSSVLSESLANAPGVDRVTDQRQYLDQIFNVLNVASITAVVIAGLMLVAAALLISTTIRLSAFSRRRELGIMRLVGASNRFIQTPFILEGVFAALIGSLLAGATVVAIVQFFVRDKLAAAMPTTSLVTVGDALIVVPILVVVGIVVAAVSANFAISRYLRV